MRKVSVIVPIYNAEPYLYNTITSIVNQTYFNIEIILIDDNSKDASLNICKMFAKKDNRIKIIKNKKNKGVSYSRNKGIDIATGKYIIFVDSDDTIEKNYIFELVNANKKDFYDIVIVNFKNVFVKNSKKNNNVIKPNVIDTSLLNGKFFDDYYYIKSVLTTPWGKLFKREIIQENNIRFPVDVDSAEDYAFDMQYYCLVKQYKFLDLCLYNYFYRKNKSLSQKNTIGNFKNHLKIIKEEYDFFYKYNIKNKEIMLGDCLVMRCLGYMVLRESLSYSDCRERLNLLKLVTKNPRKCTKIKDKIILKLINKNIYLPVYLYCFLRVYAKFILKGL